MNEDEQDELSEQELEEIFRDYLAAGRSVYLPELLDQGNSKKWEKDVEDYLIDRKFNVSRKDKGSPDFKKPLNFDLKVVRNDRKTKSFSLSGLTLEEATSKVLDYRLVILAWDYDTATSCGHPKEAVVLPRDLNEYLTQWSFTGIHVKTGINPHLLERKGIIYNGGSLPSEWITTVPVEQTLF